MNLWKFVEILDGPIPYGTFSNCSMLENIILPKNLESIGEMAFYYCEGLKNLVIPNSVINLGENIFVHCFNLTIYCESTVKNENWENNWNVIQYADDNYLWYEEILTYWYSETRPTTTGNYWHYVDGVVAKW